MSDLQDTLGQIKARHQEVGRADSAEGTFALDQSQADVPGLVEAIEAVLEKCGHYLKWEQKNPKEPFEFGLGEAARDVQAILADKLTGEDDE